MKQFLLVLLVILWPATARATLFTYDISVLFLAEYLADPRYGNVQVGVSFPQETTLDYPQTLFFLPDLPRELYPTWSVERIYGDSFKRDSGGGFWSLSAITPTDFRFGIGDPAGNFVFDLLYDENQSDNAPFREPDRLLVNFGYELGVPPRENYPCNDFPNPPCPIGTGDVHTFEKGEFSFARSHVNQVAEPAALVLLACGLLLMGIVKFRYSF